MHLCFEFWILFAHIYLTSDPPKIFRNTRHFNWVTAYFYCQAGHAFVTEMHNYNRKHRSSTTPFLHQYYCATREAGIAKSVKRLLQVGRCGDRIPVGARFFAPVHTESGDHPTSYTISTESFPGYNGRGVALTEHPI
jgi:hypothetical protein